MGDALDITALGAVPGPPEENDVLDITALGAISPPEDDDVLDLFEEGAIDPRFSAYLPDGKVMPGGRLDPNRSEAELEQLQQELAERGDRLSPFELSLLYRHRTNKPITEQAAEGMTTLFSGLAQVGRALFGLPGELSGKERDPLALQVGRALTPLTGVLQLASERMRADPSTRLHELPEFKFTENVGKNLVEGAAVGSAGGMTLLANAAESLANLYLDPLDLDEQADFDRFVRRQNRNQDLAIVMGRGDLGQQAVVEVLDGAAALLENGGFEEDADFVAEMAKEAVKHDTLKPDTLKPGVQLLSNIAFDPTTLAISPTVKVGQLALRASGAQRLAGQALGKVAKAGEVVTSAPTRAIQAVGRSLGKEVSEQSAGRIAMAIGGTVGGVVAADQGDIFSLAGLGGIAGGALGGRALEVALFKAPNAFKLASETLPRIASGSDALETALRRAAQSTTSPTAARVLNKLDLATVPVEFALRRGADIGVGAVQDAVLGYLAEPTSLERAGEEIGEGILFSAIAGLPETGRSAELTRRALDRFEGRVGREQAERIKNFTQGNEGQMLGLAGLDLFLRGASRETGADVEFQYLSQDEYENAVAENTTFAPELVAEVYGRTGGFHTVTPDGRNLIFVNLDRASGKTPFHEAFHALTYLNMEENYLGNLRKLILGSIDPATGRMLGDGLYTESELVALEQEYVGKLDAAQLDRYFDQPAEQRWDRIFQEVGAEYFADWAQGKKLNRVRDVDFQASYVGGVLSATRSMLGKLGLKFDFTGDVTTDPKSDIFQSLKKSPLFNTALKEYVTAKNSYVERIASSPESAEGVSITAGEIISRDELRDGAVGYILDPEKVDVSGRPEVMTPKRRKEVDRQINSGLFSIIDSLAGDEIVRIAQGASDKTNQIRITKPLSDETIDRIMQSRDSRVPTSVRNKLARLNESLKNRGTPYMASYYGAIKAGKTRSQDRYDSSIVMTTPVFHVLSINISDAGNLFIRTFEHGHFFKKLSKTSPKKLALWEGSKEAFFRDVQDVFEAHDKGVSAITAVGKEKAEAIFDFLDIDNLTSDRDRPNSLVRSRRLDRIATLSKTTGVPMPIDYARVKARFSPEAQQLRFPFAYDLPDADGFRSQAQSVIASKFRGRFATPEQIKAALTNPQNRVKQEEIEWTGVLQEIDKLAEDNGGKVPIDQLRSMIDLQSKLRFQEVESDYEPSYEEYTLPGGVDYRETVMTIDESGTPRTVVKAEPVSQDTLVVGPVPEGEIWSVTFNDGKTHRVYATRAISETEAKARALKEAGPFTGVYVSPHFKSVDGYIAHKRTKTRMDDDGNVGTFIEELQSDRHSAARKTGYGPLPDKVPDAPFRTSWPLQLFKLALRDAVNAGHKWVGWTDGKTQAERYEITDHFSRIEYIPDSPGDYSAGELVAFDLDGRNVIEQSILREDLPQYIGDDLADRINKQIDSVGAEEEWSVSQGEEGFVVVNFDGDEMTYADGTPINFRTEEDAENYITTNLLEDPSIVLEDDDLFADNVNKLGTLYDKILPKEIGKYVKQWGAKVEEGPLGLANLRPPVRYWRVDINPEMAREVQLNGQVRFSPGTDPDTGLASPAESDTVSSDAERADRLPEAGARTGAQEGGLRQPGGVGRGEGWVPPPDSPYPPTTAPALEGLPGRVKVDGREIEFGPFEPARQAAIDYTTQAGIEYNPPTTYARVDRERAARIADEFERMPHAPDDPAVRASYEAMIAETLAQYEAIKATGLVAEPIPPGQPDPYGNPRNAILDVVENNHMWFFPTTDGFGTEGSLASEKAFEGRESVDVSDNPLLRPTGEVINGYPMLANDTFRVVHDYFGHIKEGVGFRADGEENAWRSHSAMYSDLARPAMTSETRGQNSWVNFGPFGEFNRTAGPADTQYAPQKLGLLPQWAIDEGRFSPGVTKPRTRPGKSTRAGVKSETVKEFPMTKLGKGKTSFIIKSLEDGTNHDQVYARIDKQTAKVRDDPERLVTPTGWNEYFRKTGVSGVILTPPSGLATMIKSPSQYLDLIQGGYHGDLTVPGIHEAARAGLDGTVAMREALAGNYDPWILALHHMWGVLSKQLPPVQQEGMWLRLLSDPDVRHRIQQSIDGKFRLHPDTWKKQVARSRDATGSDTEGVGNQGTSNANSFYAMLKRWNRKWSKDVARIYQQPDSTAMGREFWKVRAKYGAVDIKNKVQRFIGLTYGIPGLIMDRWKFVEYWLPDLMARKGVSTPREYFRYTNNVPEDPLAWYGAASGPEGNNPVFSLSFYEGMEAAIESTIANSPELQQFLGPHANVAGLHWHGWNAIKNEAVGHSSLDLTLDLLRSGKPITVDSIGEQLDAKEYYTEGTTDTRTIVRLTRLPGGRFRVERRGVSSG